MNDTASRIAPATTLAALLMLASLTWTPRNGHAAEVAPQRGSPVSTAPMLPKGGCAQLTQVDVVAIGGPGSRITRASETTDAQGQAVCAVDGTLAPTITFRVELPLRTWTGRYLQTGCGGLCGNLSLRIGAADGCSLVRAGGFVVASTDMGHQGMSAEFGRDPQKRADFAYRGVHLTAVAAKALIRAFYGQAARHAYFSGCSDGGREALIEAQRYPEDFDGIIAGAPAMVFSVQNSLFHAWQARSNTDAKGRPILIAARLPILHDAVLAACDKRDGQADGLIVMPGECRFDPRSIVCKPGEVPDRCLTAAEADTARKFYEGPRDPQTGARLTQGGPAYGSELQWAGVYVPHGVDQPIFSTSIAEGSMADLIFTDGKPARVADVNFDEATLQRTRARHALFDATNPDLSAFARRGGKLLLFHGWADPHISPLNTIAYHEAVQRQMGVDATRAFERLYLLPGMGHCSGGEGPSEFDLLTPLIAWVEGRRAPDAIVTSTPRAEERSLFGLPGGGAGRDGPPPAGARLPPLPQASPAPVARSRPVYPYPHVAAYRGTGDPLRAENYVRGDAAPVPVPKWAGSDLFAPYEGVTR